MKAISLHGMAPDNAGTYHEAGAQLTVSEDLKGGCICAERAKHLVGIGSAAVVEEKAEKAK